MYPATKNCPLLLPPLLPLLIMMAMAMAMVVQTKAYLFGRGPGHKPEGWEGIMLATWIASAAVLFVGVGMGPQTSIKVSLLFPALVVSRPAFVCLCLSICICVSIYVRIYVCTYVRMIVCMYLQYFQL